MNEEAKRSMTEWQEKLDKVTKDSEERISELQQKLSKVRENIHELKQSEIIDCQLNRVCSSLVVRNLTAICVDIFFSKNRETESQSMF